MKLDSETFIQDVDTLSLDFDILAPDIQLWYKILDIDTFILSIYILLGKIQAFHNHVSQIRGPSPPLNKLSKHGLRSPAPEMLK